MLLHALRCAEPNDCDRAVQILSRRRPGSDGELGLSDLLDRLAVRGELSRAGQAEIVARLRGHQPSESKSLNDIRWLYELMVSGGSLKHARDVAAVHAREAATVLASLDWLPPSQHRDALVDLVDYVNGRTR
jgi:geranylgeranyl diphosphate synthase type II